MTRFTKTVKGVIYTNIYYHLLTLELFQTCLSFFVLLNIKEGILKNEGNSFLSLLTSIIFCNVYANDMTSVLSKH